MCLLLLLKELNKLGVFESFRIFYLLEYKSLMLIIHTVLSQTHIMDTVMFASNPNQKQLNMLGTLSQLKVICIE